MTNYNDGNWHGWNGGECPVHPMSDVEAITLSGHRTTLYAQGWRWSHDNPGDKGNIIAFRVVKEHREHREPREWWLVGLMAHDNKKDAVHTAETYGAEFIHVREVLE